MTHTALHVSTLAGPAGRAMRRARAEPFAARVLVAATALVFSLGLAWLAVIVFDHADIPALAGAAAGLWAVLFAIVAALATGAAISGPRHA